jgi:outer membrane receptor protein involved in Fe transport
MAPDIDPNDLARVEVLRGPQGTLYGASSMGGLINYVTVDPSTDGIGGSLQVGSTSVSHGGGIGFNVRGAVNVPLSDALAVRVSAFTRREPGYVDNHFFGDPEHGIGKDVNQTDAHGGRLSALWKPSDGFSLKLSAQLQTLKTDASPYVTLRSGLGDLQQSVLRGEGWLNRDARAYSATIKAKLGRVDLTSVSGYNEGPLRSTYDFSPTVGPCCSQPIFGVTGAVSHNSVKADNFSQEIRLSAQLGERMDWVVGGFYTHQKSTFVGNIIAVDSASGSSPGSVLFDHTGPQKYEESAVFANLTYQVTDRLDVQFGGRQSRNRQSFAQELSGILFCPTADPADPACAGYVDGTFFSPANQSSSSVSDNSFTYLVTPRLKLSRDLMVYARLASGYRPGWTNGSLASAFGYPSEVEHDTTTNYEVGVKGAILDHALYFDASVYYIDWKDIPVFITDPVSFFGYGANAGGAKSQGMELSVTAKPMRTLSIAAWAAWNVAELTQDLPAGAPGASSGDRLPFSSRFSGYLTLDQEFALTSSITGFLGGSVSYTSNRKGNFGASPLFGGNGERQTYPGYAKADVRVGARYDSWTINLFVNNVTDKRAEIGGGLGGFFGPNSFVLIQPLTVGLSLSKSFD